MKIFSNTAPITIKNETRYLALIFLLIPLMNFFGGIVIDLYAPSLPAIASHFHTTITAAKNTITFTMLGFAVGCIIFGLFFDTFGRRQLIILAFIGFIIASLIAPFCHSISQLMLIRFIQGLMTAAMSIGSRTLAADYFSNHKFIVIIMYTSFANGLGPVIGPFIGGFIQYHFGWQANFYVFTIAAIIIGALFYLFVHEKFHKTSTHTFMNAFLFYKIILKDKLFLVCALTFGLIQIDLMIYPTLAPFLIEHQLNYTAITYGNTALIVGLGYLLGTLSNRILLKTFLQPSLIKFGFSLFALSLSLQLFFVLFSSLNLFTLVIPITLLGYALGFIYGNLLSNTLKLFPDNIGITSSLFSFSLMFIAAVGIFIISYVKVSTLNELFYIILVTYLLQLIIYNYFIKAKLFSHLK